MSDCRNGGRNVYRIPEDREPGVLYDHGQPNYDYLQARAIVVGGVRFERVRECEMGVLDTGNEAAYEHYEYIMHCTNCHHEFGYVQYDEDGDTWMDDKPRFCPHCGAKVRGGGDD